MAVQFGAAVLDDLLAPGISCFSEVEVPDLSEELQRGEHWLSNLFLNTLLGPRYTPAWKQAAITFIFRTQSALRSYQFARTATLGCVNAFRPGRPASKLYFEAASHWEAVVLNIQIAIDLYRRVLAPQSLATDDSVRISKAANRIKHYGEDIEKGRNTDDLTLPMWMTRTGIKTATAEVSFAELAENLQGMVIGADVLENPQSVAPANL